MEFKDDYKTMSGWIHDYYCDKDGAELIFDISNNKYFECPICHHKYNDEKRKRAWIIKYRYKIFNTIEEYSKKYLEEKDKNYLEYIELALEYYSLNYDKFAIHNKNGEIFYDYKNGENRCGKITGQGLNEAMISIQIVNCIDNIGDALSYEIKKDCFNILFPQIYELLKPQVNKIRNIECYEICAIAMMGIISNNKEMLDYAFNSQFSFYSQIEEGVNKDYFWFEGSFHYHLFVLKPILELLKIARKYQYQIPEKYYNIAKEMLMQSYKCSFADGSLPSPNDGWANRHLSAYIKDFELGEEIFNGEFDKIINKINNNNYGTIHCFNSGFSMLKNEYWNVFIKYKDFNTNHSHPDKLNIEIKLNNNFLTHDLSTSGYGSNICKDFYKKTYSHNTIVIDGENQNLECNSIVNLSTENVISIASDDIYRESKITREIKLDNDKMFDKITVKCSETRTIDYFFHSDAKITNKIDGIDVKKIVEYPYLKDIKKVNCELGNVLIEWDLNGIKLATEINLDAQEIYLCKSPDNPNSKGRTTLLIRTKGTEMNVDTQFYLS